MKRFIIGALFLSFLVMGVVVHRQGGRAWPLRDVMADDQLNGDVGKTLSGSKRRSLEAPSVEGKSLEPVSAGGAGGIIFSCKATKILDGSYFEEALSVDEYPEVDLEEDGAGSKRLRVGEYLFEQDRGDHIKILPAVGFGVVMQFRGRGGRETYTILISREIRQDRPVKAGTILGRGEKWSDDVIAELDCR